MKTPAAEAIRWPLELVVMHWLTALLVAAQYALATMMTDEARGLLSRFALYQWHKSIGLVVACLVMLRLAFRCIRRPMPEVAMPAWQRRAARLVHACLYLCLIALPATGFLMVCAAPIQIPTVLFGVLAIPHPIGPDPVLYRSMMLWHERSFDALATLAGIHASAALLHQYVLKDGLMRRMGLRGRFYTGP